jgi:hypothetical protein
VTINEINTAKTYRNSRKAQIGLSRQLPLHVAAGFGVSLELSLQGLDLLLGQARTREVLCVFVVVHDGLVVVVEHLHRRMGVEIAINGVVVHHRRRHHGRVIGHGVVHWETRVGLVVP